MKILVCVKQVHDPERRIQIDPAQRMIVADEPAGYRINRYDEYAVEEALRLKEMLPGASVHILSLGPPRVESAIRRALGMGADHGILLHDEQDDPRDPFLVASAIAAFAGEKKYDLILTGAMSEDAMQSQVGQTLAAILSLPCLTLAVSIQVNTPSQRLKVEREIEGGYRDVLEVAMPALLTIQTGINQPRYPALSHLLRANRAVLETCQAFSTVPPSPRQEITRLAYPQKSRSGLTLSGSPAEKAARFWQLLRERALAAE